MFCTPKAKVALAASNKANREDTQINSEFMYNDLVMMFLVQNYQTLHKWCTQYKFSNELNENILVISYTSHVFLPGSFSMNTALFTYKRSKKKQHI